MSQYNDYGSNPYYPNAGAGGGGGYMTGGSQFGGSASGSPGGGGFARRGAASQSLRPFTVKQLLNATQAHSDAEWVVDDKEIGQVTVVAEVVSVQSQTTNCVYWLDDGSGRIEARHWTDGAGGEEEDNETGIREHMYIRVLGNLKSFGTRRYINATHLRPCKDPHEIYFHVLETAAVGLMLDRGPPPKPGEQVVHKAAPTGGASAYTAQSAAVAADQFAHFPPLQRKILQFIVGQPPNDEGVHVAAIARAVGGDAASISQALDALMDDGHVFSTIDDSHYNVSI